MLYADVLAPLIYGTLVQPVMIVVDHDSCSHQFASMLKNSTHVNTDNHQEPFYHFVNDSSNLLSDLSKMLYKATVESVATIILLCSNSLSDLILRLAKTSAISYANIIWVGIEYSSNINNNFSPPLLLSLSLELDTDDTIDILNESAERIMAAKAVASLGVKEKTITIM